MKLFTDHLDAVGEAYPEHARHALSFALAMFLGSLACLIHAVLPFLFERTGSALIARLHERMVVNRRRLSAKPVPVSASQV